MKTIYSFDVFDTCICRSYAAPEDLFFDILPGTSEISDADRSVFSINRRTGEKLANAKLGKGKCATIEAIYENIDQRYFHGYSKEYLIKREKHLELQSIRPIASTLKQIKELRTAENKIIFISDMYLSSNFIKLALIKTGFYKPGDSIYVSSENALTKRSGELFSYVLEKESIQANQLVHHGDNLASDIASAKKLGIKAIHINTSNPLPIDQIVHKEATPKEKRINAIAKIVRLKLCNQISTNELGFLAKTIPAIVAYCHWILTEAKKKKITALYFFTRDAQIMHIICSLLVEKSDQIKLLLLFGSRKAWTLPSVDFSSSDWIEKITTAYNGITLEDAAELLQLNEAAYKDLILSLSKNKKLPQSLTSEILKQLISTNPEIEKSIRNKAKEQKQLMKDYLTSIGIFEHNRCAIVDSGWTLRNQKKFMDIINEVKPKIKIEGFYFCLAPNALTEKSAGIATCFSNDRHFHYKKAIVLEHAVLGSTLYPTRKYSLCYNKSKPEFDKSVSESDHIFRNNVKYAIYFAREFKKLHLNESYINSFYEHSLINLEKILRSPTKSELEHLKDLLISHTPNQINKNLKPLFYPVTLCDVLEIFFSRIFKNHTKTYFWPEASATISKPLPKFLLKLLLKFVRLIDNSKIKLPNHNR